MMYQAIVTKEREPMCVRQLDESGAMIGSVPRGEVVDVLADNGDGWLRIRYGDLVGYASGAYLTRVSEESGDTDEGGQEGTDDPVTYTTLMRDDGMAIMLVGTWRVAND